MNSSSYFSKREENVPSESFCTNLIPVVTFIFAGKRNSHLR